MIADSSPLSGVWKKTAPGQIIAHAYERPELAKSVAWMRDQFAKLAADPDLAAEFDRKLAKLATALQGLGVLIVHPTEPARSQSVGFLLACFAAACPPSDDLYPVFITHLDRRAQREGKVYCKWRGYVSEREYDAWRWDDYQRRVKLANTGEKERAA